MPIKLTIAILAGGQSRRMGRDKAQIVANGLPMLESIAHAALNTQYSVIVVGRNKPLDWPLADVTFIPDAKPDSGPLGGLVSALRHTQSSVLAVACDMPQLTSSTIQWLIDLAAQLDGETKDGIAVTSEGELQPLFSVYHITCLADAEKRLEAGRLSLRGLILDGDFHEIAAPTDIEAQLMNVNTPEDLARITQS